MPKHYVTFGQAHVHRIAGVTFDADCVATYEADNYSQGRAIAFKLFGPVFCFDYHGEQFSHEKMLPYFPRGLVEVPAVTIGESSDE